MHLIGRVFLSVVFVLSAQSAAAQETINYGSISGRVTDPQGAVAPGAMRRPVISATNLRREAVTDQEGRFRFPYLRVGSYEIIVRLAGFADATRQRDGHMGSAFELPVTLAVAGLDTSVTVTGEATVLEACAQPDRRHGLAGRSPGSADERPQLSRSGAARSRRVADQYRKHTAVCRNVGGSRAGHFGRQPAQLFQQLHRGRAVRQR